MPLVSIDTFLHAQYDYLIVGGGNTGAALAARLSDNPNLVIGLLEAGPCHPFVAEIDIPGYVARSLFNPKYDWCLSTLPQEHANGRTIPQPRGKGLGGTSLLNFMCNTRPSKTEIDDFANTFGDEKWNWAKITELMNKSEDTRFPSPGESSPIARPNPEFHGVGGPVKQSLPIPITTDEDKDVNYKLFKTAEQLGVPINSEPFSGVNVGSSIPYTTVDKENGIRSSAFSGYLQPCLKRENLLVLTDARVTTVVFETSNDGFPKAIGVHFIYKSGEVTVHGVKKDIILSAGSYHTPQILELSGIGNKTLLSQHGIKCIVDLPGVGENMQDHVSVPIILEVDSKNVTLDAFRGPEDIRRQELLYEKERQGPLANTFAQGLLFPPYSVLFRGDLERQEWMKSVEAHTLEYMDKFSGDLKLGLNKQYSLQNKWMGNNYQAAAEIIHYIGHWQPNSSVHPAEPGKAYVTMICALMHTFSRGSAHISSSDPTESPKIDQQFLAHAHDQDLLLRMVRFILNTTQCGPFGETFRKFILPDLELGSNDTENKLVEHIKEWCNSFLHPIGTASMMSREDGGVVDKRLRVYGTSNLRVADLSILPLQLSCHPMSLAYAIAENIAEMVAEELR